jgi:hypothetical protein
MNPLLSCRFKELLVVVGLMGFPLWISVQDPQKLATRLRDKVVVCAQPGADIDGDGIPDVACITRRGLDEPQRVAVVLSKSPSAPALDLPILTCSDCGGTSVPLFDITAAAGNVEVSETSEGVSYWKVTYLFELRGATLRLARESMDTANRDSGGEASVTTDYDGQQGETLRSACSASAQGPESTSFYNLYAYPIKASIQIDGGLSESGWKSAPKLTVNSAEYAVFGATRWGGGVDLSFSVRALYDKDSLYLAIEVTDDTVVLSPQGMNGVRYDHVELWLDRGGKTWNSQYEPRLKPDPAKTFQLGLVPLRDSSKVAVWLWYPQEQISTEAIASWRRSAAGYNVEARIPLKMIGVSKTYALELHENAQCDAAVNFTLAVSDCDNPTVPRQKVILATSQIERRGAPFKMGLLHLIRSVGSTPR